MGIALGLAAEEMEVFSLFMCPGLRSGEYVFTQPHLWSERTSPMTAETSPPPPVLQGTSVTEELCGGFEAIP